MLHCFHYYKFPLSSWKFKDTRKYKSESINPNLLFHQYSDCLVSNFKACFRWESPVFLQKERFCTIDLFQCSSITRGSRPKWKMINNPNCPPQKTALYSLEVSGVGLWLFHCHILTLIRLPKHEKHLILPWQHLYTSQSSGSIQFWLGNIHTRHKARPIQAWQDPKCHHFIRQCHLYNCGNICLGILFFSETKWTAWHMFTGGRRHLNIAIKLALM